MNIFPSDSFKQKGTGRYNQWNNFTHEHKLIIVEQTGIRIKCNGERNIPVYTGTIVRPDLITVCIRQGHANQFYKEGCKMNICPCGSLKQREAGSTLAIKISYLLRNKLGLD